MAEYWYKTSTKQNEHMLYEQKGKGHNNIPACKWHEGGIRRTKNCIQHRGGRGMSYGHVSNKYRGERNQSTLMVQTRGHNTNKHIGYIMFEDLGIKYDA
eukprot:1080507-Heterocapsa_arctica.AAC.1